MGRILSAGRPGSNPRGGAERAADRPGAVRYTARMTPARRLLAYLTRYRETFLRGLVCVIIATALQLSSPWILKYAIDDLNAGVTLGKLRFYALTLVALAAVGGVFRFLMRRILIG